MNILFRASKNFPEETLPKIYIGQDPDPQHWLRSKAANPTFTVVLYSTFEHFFTAFIDIFKRCCFTCLKNLRVTFCMDFFLFVFRNLCTVHENRWRKRCSQYLSTKYSASELQFFRPKRLNDDLTFFLCPLGILYSIFWCRCCIRNPAPGRMGYAYIFIAVRSER
jgi:hypothetical protein